MSRLSIPIPTHLPLYATHLLETNPEDREGRFIVKYLENRCKLTLDECIALFPTVEIFQAAWFWPIGMIES
jgi:hypothetical protein